jgi:hypothetical protein
MIEDEAEEDDNLHDCDDLYKGVVWVFANISGLITFLPDGTIHNINENFSLMLFGFKSSEIIGKVRHFIVNASKFSVFEMPI